MREQICRPNHKPRKSILVEYEFFLDQNALKLHFYHLPKFGSETPTTKQNRIT